MTRRCALASRSRARVQRQSNAIATRATASSAYLEWSHGSTAAITPSSVAIRSVGFSRFCLASRVRSRKPPNAKKDAMAEGNTCATKSKGASQEGTQARRRFQPPVSGRRR